MPATQEAEAAAGRVRESSFRAFLAAGGASVVASLDLDILSFEVRHAVLRDLVATQHALCLGIAMMQGLCLCWPCMWWKCVVVQLESTTGLNVQASRRPLLPTHVA